MSFTNNGETPVDLTGWTVADESSSSRYTFGAVILPVGGTITLASWCGDDAAERVHWCVTAAAVWNNAGDTVLLRDPAGNIAAQLTY